MKVENLQLDYDSIRPSKSVTKFGSKTAKKSKFDFFEERVFVITGIFLLSLYLYLRLSGQKHVWDHEMDIFYQSKEAVDSHIFSSISSIAQQNFEDLSLHVNVKIKIDEGLDWETLIEEERRRYSKDEVELKIRETLLSINNQHKIINEYASSKIRKIAENCVDKTTNASTISSNSFSGFIKPFIDTSNLVIKSTSYQSRMKEKLDVNYLISTHGFLCSRIDSYARRIIDAKSRLIDAARIEARLQNILHAISILSLPPVQSQKALAIKQKSRTLQQKISSRIKSVEIAVDNHFETILTHIKYMAEYESNLEISIAPGQNKAWPKIEDLFDRFYSSYQLN